MSRKGAMERRYTWDRAQLTPEELKASLGPIPRPLGPQDNQVYPKDQEAIDKAVAEFKRKKREELQMLRKHSKPT